MYGLYLTEALNPIYNFVGTLSLDIQAFGCFELLCTGVVNAQIFTSVADQAGLGLPHYWAEVFVAEESRMRELDLFE